MILFYILGRPVYLTSEDTEYGRNTVAIIDGEYFYLGNENPSISSAIFAWESLNYRTLSNQELKQVLTENKLVD